ncbi:MAG: selenocysteine-specific translation elongation factor [Desulfobacterales bacterium C00003060]|nr:MAG: selenocysteine-specific translation elongation factor [Desulfobacterales bacterium S3730MH5]OEU78290.1 MAG: selenocysteine-specific translation elongation factor [Desulfobacterales bacterium C00003060]OEU82758.1 MAG: selenocysteine-specific translation elongation factor [Desulfobacterales bacterium S5133MH4]
MKQIILGTAGHIDHGKTTLIKALTGIDTDRLKEEKLRGITIELGFAWLDLPGGQRVGIVDVPGHEKFVKNMVSGASGVDLVALIIAADEGVMPQTKEHLDICSLLNVHHGLVVLTKMDMVDEEWLEMVTEDVKGFLGGTCLESAPVVPVSSSTGQGFPQLLETLENLCRAVPERSSNGLFRLPVDRVFTMKGFGTVVTGSLVSGKVRVGETIMIYPSGIQSKVRGIQVHGKTVDVAVSSMRTAINFQGVDRSSIARGDVVGGVNTLKSSYMVDCLLAYLPSNGKPLKNRTKVRFHTCTSEILGHAILLDREELLPGETAVAQFRLDTPVAVVKDDRFVIRSYSPIRTIGGGQILNPVPRKHKRFKEPLVTELKALAESPDREIIAYHVRKSGILGVGFSELRPMTNLSEKDLEQHLQHLLSKRAIIQLDRENRTFIHGSVFDGLRRKAIKILEDYHKDNPLKTGMSGQGLKAKLAPSLTSKLFSLLVHDLAKSNIIFQEKEAIRLFAHRVALGADQKDVRHRIEQTYRQSGLQPPYFRDLVTSMGQNPVHVKEILMHMLEEETLVKVKEDLFFHRRVVEDLKDRLVFYLKAHNEVTTPQFKEMTGVSRKYTIPLIEYFDTTKVTIRVGDVRRLREG